MGELDNRDCHEKKIMQASKNVTSKNAILVHFELRFKYLVFLLNVTFKRIRQKCGFLVNVLG